MHHKMKEQYGYAGKILKVDLCLGRITHIPTMDYAHRFVGGRGIAAKIYWDEVSSKVNALDPENPLIFMTGPLAGHPGLAGSRFTVCGKSPITTPEQFSHTNLSGSWGAHLKFAGYDGILVQGKSDKPVYLLIQDGTAQIMDASHLWGKGAIEVREILKQELGGSVRVVACGPAGENMVLFANLLADGDASGSGGFGAVMGSKRLKAIAVSGSSKVAAANPEMLQHLTGYIRESTSGGPILLTTLGPPVHPPGPNMRRQPCYGCSGNGCPRLTYEAVDGTKGKFMCGSALLYQELAHRYYGEWTEVPFYANKLCDNYGLDTLGVAATIGWLGKCHRTGILTEENTGIPLSQMGSLEFIQALVKKISLREGFGDVLAQGLVHAADEVGGGSKQLLANYSVQLSDKSQEPLGGDPRLFIPVAIFFATDARVIRSYYQELLKPLAGWLAWIENDKDAYVSSDVWRVIARRFLGGELAIDFSTYDGKALAAKIVQDRQSIIASLMLCLYIFPIVTVKKTEDHVGDPALESKIFSAVAGREMDEEGLRRIGEVVFNLERAIRVREGHRGKESDTLPEFYYTTPLERNVHSPECLAPGQGGEVISRKGAVVDRQKFQSMMDEYYQLRGWDVASGLQAKEKLMELGLGDVASDLEPRGLAR
ncbi:aldehyde ferredoxin oxidoreductase N-terminal domain-containing protein [Chloroflexota bacterium]